MTQTAHVTNPQQDVEPKGPSKVSELAKQYDEATKLGKAPPQKEIKDAIALWNTARADWTKATQEAEIARERHAKATERLARAIGARPFRYKGRLYEFSSRGDLVFIRERGGEKIIELS